jgi:DNA-binding CsgD family transcriptional regulator
MDRLERALQATQQGRGHCFLIAGEAGLGKSRLLAETRTRAMNRGFLVLQGYCFEPDLSFPYAPLIDALRPFLAHRPASEVAAILGPLASELVKLLPELALMLPNLQPTPALDPESEKRRCFEVLIQFSSRLAASQPLLVIVEDIHWSDEASLDFLYFLARRLVASPVLLLASYRREETTPQLTHLLIRLNRERLAQEIGLNPLQRTEVETMLRAIFDLKHPVRTDFVEAIYTLTEGNPFFIEEILKSLVTTGELFDSQGQWERRPLAELHLPRTLLLAVQERLEQLNPTTRQLVTLAAVIGRRFDFVLLQALSHQDETEILSQIKELIGAQLVVEASAEQFAFRHALTREAIYATLLARERRRLHQFVAETMERLYLPDNTPDAYTADLAYHFYEAGNWEKALPYAQRAGEKAHSLYALRAAIEQFNRAGEAARRLSLAPAPALYRLRGQAHELLGDFEAARADYAAALETARAAQDDRAEWQSLLALGFLWSGRDYTRAGDYLRRALAVARLMGDPMTLAHSLNRLGNWHLSMEQPLEAQGYHQEALGIFQSTNNRPGLAETLDLLGVTHFMSGNLAEGVRYYEQAIALFRELDERQGLVSSLAMFTMRGGSYTFSTSCYFPTSLAECVGNGEEAHQIARQMGWRAGEATALLYLALSLGPRGEYNRALALAQATLDIAGEIQHPILLLGAHFALGVLNLDLLALPAAQAHLELAQGMAREAGSFFVQIVNGFLASIYVAQGELALAETIIEAALGAAGAAQTQGQRLAWCARAELALAHHQPEAALQILDGLIASAPNVEQSGPGCIPRLWTLRGQALTELQRFAEAEAILRIAHQGALAQELRPMLWRIHAALGQLYQVQRRYEEATGEFAAGQKIIETLAANLSDDSRQEEFLHHATDLLSALTPSPRRAAKQAFGGLTKREREVAALLAQGKSNREIAHTLVITERTVEAHVGNILAKLNYTSRAQIAVWAAERGLRTEDRE